MKTQWVNLKPQALTQGSEAWVKARLGKVTASRIADVMARTKTGWGASRANYAAELIAERLTGEPAEHYVSAAMQWGKDTEAEARAAFEFYTNSDVELVGFIPHPSIAMAGASPDGLVGSNGLVEFKCPHTSTHIDSLLDGAWSNKYYLQTQWQMACTGRQWCALCSYDPRMPAAMRLLVDRVERCPDMISDLEKAVFAFLVELDDKLARLTTRYGAPGAQAA